MKKLLSALLILALTLSPALAAGNWYDDAVAICMETGLMEGKGDGFDPHGIMTVGEAAAVAARVAEPILSWSIPGADPALPWYTRYVDYLTELKTIGLEVTGLEQPTANATRQIFFALLAVVTSTDKGLTPLNTITALPDTADAGILRLYNAGLLTGTDKYGTFAGEKALTRAECAAILARIARPELRTKFTPADYRPFTAAGLVPGAVLFPGVTAEEYLGQVLPLIAQLEADCAAQGLEFNWFHTYGGQSALDHVKQTALANLSVTADKGTVLYKAFDLQVFYSRYLDLKGEGRA